MHSSLILALVLALKPVPYPSVPPMDDDVSGGGVSPVVGSHNFDNMGRADFGPGIPTPTYDCISRSSSGDVDCNGASSQAYLSSDGGGYGDATVVTLDSQCWPDGAPLWVAVTETDHPGETLLRFVISCPLGKSDLTLSEAIPLTWTNTLRFTPTNSAGFIVTKSGNPTTSGSPFWYRGDTSPRNAVRVSSSDFYRLGDTPRSGSFTEVFAFRPVLTATYIYLISKGGDAGFIARINSAGTVQIYVNGATALSCGAVASGSWYVLTYAYERLTEGTSRIRCSLNGSAGTEVTNAGLLVATGNDLLLTDREDAPPTGHPFSGDLRRYSRIDGFAASATQIAQLVASQWGLLADRPSTALVSHSRTDSTLCCPFTDAQCEWVGPGAPCIHAPTYSGWSTPGLEIYGAGANKVTRSNDLSGWTIRGTGAVTSTTIVAPDGTATASRVSSKQTGQDVYLDVTGFVNSGPVSLSLWAKQATSTSGTITIQNPALGTAGGQWTVNLATLPSTWTRLRPTSTYVSVVNAFAASGTGGSGVHFVGDGTQRDMDVWLVQETDGSVTVPPRATTGTAYAGSAGTATVVGTPWLGTSLSDWAWSVTAARASWTATDALLLSLGAYGTANSAGLRAFTDGKIYFDTGDPVAGLVRVSATHGFTAGTMHTILGGNQSTVQRLAFDGIEQSTSATITGTGVWGSVPSTLSIGNSGVGTLQPNGTITRFVQCKRFGGCR